LEVIVAEHVFEHLTWHEAKIATKLCHDYIKPGGTLRLAVPDVNRYKLNRTEMLQQRKNDIDWKHRINFNWKTIKYLLQPIFPHVVLLEWHTRLGFAYSRRWNPLDGFVQRTKHFDKRGQESLLVDAFKMYDETTFRGCQIYDIEARHQKKVVRDRVRAFVETGQYQKALHLDPFDAAALQLAAKNSVDYTIIARMRQEQ